MEKYTLGPNNVRVHNLILRPTIVIQFFFLEAIMAEAIPLRARLRIKCENVVVDGARRLVVNVMVERLSAESRRRHAVQRPVCRDACAVSDFFGSVGRVLGREQVNGARLIVVAVETPGVAPRAVFAEWE